MQLSVPGLAALLAAGAISPTPPPAREWNPVGAYTWGVDLKELNSKVAGTLTVTRRDDGSLYAYGTSDDMGDWGFIASSVKMKGDSLEVVTELRNGEVLFMFAPAGLEYGGRWRISEIGYQVSLVMRKR
ncbi:MAG: hypothetical protein ABI647_05085 [Gemmatimonadota bacterium]